MDNAIGHLLVLCTLRCLPFAVYAVLRRDASVHSKVLISALYLAVVLAAGELEGAERVGWIFAGAGYYALCACAVPRCTRALRERALTPAALFGCFAIAYLVVPTIALGEAQYAMFLVLGWELLLCSYSYCHDNKGSAAELPLGPCLFFLLVDPTLTYSSRGKPLRASEPARRAMARIALGLGVLGLANAVLRPAYIAVLDFQQAMPPLLAALAFGVLRFLTEYAGHSGLASVQSGLMRHAGYEVPERYRLPWLARDPLDFWRRWNTYVGQWLRQYVFMPLSRRMRAFGNRTVRDTTVVLATLLASGLLHDVYSYIAGYAPRHLSGLFVASGAAMALWTVLGRAVAPLRESSRSWSLLFHGLSRLGVGAAVVAAAVVWG